jgi:LmbE family N-acetylglucosaminyl deacetylase
MPFMATTITVFVHPHPDDDQELIESETQLI